MPFYLITEKEIIWDERLEYKRDILEDYAVLVKSWTDHHIEKFIETNEAVGNDCIHIQIFTQMARMELNARKVLYARQDRWMQEMLGINPS